MDFGKRPFLILDGALATELERQGADLRDDLWSAKLLAEDPSAIRHIHEAYLRAGADVITTSSYQATVQGFVKKGFSKSQAIDLLKLSTRLAMEARDSFLAKHPVNFQPTVAVSLGAYGAALADGSEYRGDYKASLQELKDFHRQRLDVLAPEGGDILLFETIPCLKEIRAITEIISDNPGFEVAVSMSCEKAPTLRSGEPLNEALNLLNECAAVSIISFNCTHPANISGLLDYSRTRTVKLLMVYPNSGEIWDAQRKCWMENPDDKSLTDYAAEWLQKGAKLIGGCCRTTPEEIRRLHEMRAELELI
ncbi:MAG: homocysteine S-methyltransferase [Saprospiraceae bacterium]